MYTYICICLCLFFALSIGSVYADQGMGEEAFADLNKALKLNPNHIGSLVKKGPNPV